jgi:hypothetical protein
MERFQVFVDKENVTKKKKECLAPQMEQWMRSPFLASVSK